MLQSAPNHLRKQNIMRELVAFLIENFADIQACPTGQDLGQVLSIAGFEDKDISDALTIMQLLENTAINNTQPENPSFRLYHEEEKAVLSAKIIGLLHFLYETQSLSFTQREFVIHALMHLPEDDITLENAKSLTLLILWAHRSEVNILIGEDLLSVLHGQSMMQ